MAVKGAHAHADAVSHPRHYAGDGSVECMEAMRSMMSAAPDGKVKGAKTYWWGCAFKYLWRWPLKNGPEDLMKAAQCIEYLLDEVKGVGKRVERERISVVPEEFATITQGSRTWTEPYKQCPHCSSHVLESFAFCPKCGHEFARRPLGKTGTFLANETCADGE